MIESPSVSSAFTCSCVIPEFGMLAETPLDESRDLECVLAGLAEEREELGGPRGQAESHARGTLTNWRYFGGSER